MRLAGGNSRAGALITSEGRRHRPDYLLVVLAISLLVTGLIVVFAISPGLSAQRNVPANYFVTKQLTAILLGIVAFFVASRLRQSTWKALIKPLLAAAIITTVIALLLPVTPEYPAHRWIRFAGFSFQAVEVIKFALLIWLAYFLAERMKQGKMHDNQLTFKPLLILLGLLGFVVAVLQSDLGSAGVVVAMLGAMSFVAGLPMRRVGIIFGIIVIGTLLAISTSGYRRERFLTFLNPERDCQNAGYQACQAITAIGSGGLIGKGFQGGVGGYGYVPESANDSIFAIYAEMFGFVGVTVLLTLFVALFSRLKNIAERAPDNASRLIVIGVLAWLGFQTIVNIGAMVGLLPLKGITLPLVSYGGTSILFVSAALGVVFNISKYTTFTVNETASERSSGANTAYRRGHRGAYHPPVSRRA